MIENGREKGSMNHQKGFTMLEGVMVFAIIAIVAAIAVPQFRKMAINGNLKAAGKDIISDFASMRGRAISENQNYSIVFDQTKNNYTVPGLAQPKSPAYFARDISISAINFGTGSTLTFQTRGTIYPASPASKTLTLINGRGSTATITTTTTGRVYVQYNLK
jgi:prepilin-type N-terminal cleavage/methylation domain-containing protein